MTSVRVVGVSVFLALASQHAVEAQPRAATSGATGTTVEVERRVLLTGGITLDEAKADGMREAAAEAVRMVVGTEVRSVQSMGSTETETALTEAFASVVRTTAYGRVVQQRVVKEDIETVTVGGIAQRYLLVRGVFTVLRERGSPDPGFRVRLTVNRDVYADRGDIDTNDEIIATVTATAPGHLTLFHVTEDSVEVMLPNAMGRDQRVEANVPFEFPSARQRAPDGPGIHWRAEVPKGKRAAKPLIVAVVTRQPVPFEGVERGVPGDRHTVATMRGTLTALNRWLVNIPLADRAVADLLYEVRRTSSATP